MELILKDSKKEWLVCMPAKEGREKGGLEVEREEKREIEEMRRLKQRSE